MLTGETFEVRATGSVAGGVQSGLEKEFRQRAERKRRRSTGRGSDTQQVDMPTAGERVGWSVGGDLHALHESGQSPSTGSGFMM
jgi:hypothetical protein